MSKQRLDARDKFPSGLEEYLSQNGWHFNKRLCSFAIEHMYEKDVNGSSKQHKAVTKEEVDNILKNNNIKLKDTTNYDYVYVFNMAIADFYGSSITDERKLSKFVKDYCEDVDAYDGMPLTRYYADLIGSGTSIAWEDML